MYFFVPPAYTRAKEEAERLARRSTGQLSPVQGSPLSPTSPASPGRAYGIPSPGSPDQSRADALDLFKQNSLDEPTDHDIREFVIPAPEAQPQQSMKDGAASAVQSKVGVSTAAESMFKLDGTSVGMDGSQDDAEGEDEEEGKKELLFEQMPIPDSPTVPPASVLSQAIREKGAAPKAKIVSRKIHKLLAIFPEGLKTDDGRSLKVNVRVPEDMNVPGIMQACSRR